MTCRAPLLRSDEFRGSADRWAAYGTSDKDAFVIEHGSRMILSRLGHCAKKSEVVSCGVVQLPRYLRLPGFRQKPDYRCRLHRLPEPSRPTSNPPVVEKVFC